MLQSIRPPSLAMPQFGHGMPLSGVQRMEGYGDTDAWQWPQPGNSQSTSYTPIFDHSVYAHLNAQPQVAPRHDSIQTSHLVTPGRSTPPQRHQPAANLVKPQPAFKPTWHGFLDTTKDAMIIVEATLQGRLGHISRRPHDKERAEMLTSGTVLVYEENASGIKRWTDAVHWSPSRVMNNCLIYRQLTRALKPEEKRSALNPSCGGKRKRKESVGPAVTKAGENLNNSDDEYDNPVFAGAVAGDISPVEPSDKVYANFAQSLTPDQQRRFCGSLIDSYEFKEGGLMKKTISVKYNGTNHHVISYYTLEDVANNKLMRPGEDPKLRDIQPRPELLTGWKVGLEDEESKEQAQYPQHTPTHMSHRSAFHSIQGVNAHGLPVGPPHLTLQVPQYWQGNPVQHYASPQSAAPYVPQSDPSQYSVQQPSAHHYSPQVPNTAQPYPTASPQHGPSPQAPIQRYPSPSSAVQQYSPQTRPHLQYPAAQQPSTVQNYAPPPQYPSAPQDTISQASQYPASQPPVMEFGDQGSIQQQSAYRRTSAPMVMQQPYNHPTYSATPQTQTPTYYVPDTKFNSTQSFGY